MGKEIEALEDDADFAPQPVHIDAGTRHAIAGQKDLTSLNRFKSVDAAKQCRLAATGRPDQAHDLMLLDRQIETSQDFDGTKFLLNFPDFEK
jgi:hypothetical protein